AGVTALGTGTAQAQSIEAEGIQVEHFEPLPDQHTNILNVATSSTLGHLGFSLGAFTHFVSEPARLVLVDQDGDVQRTVDPIIDYQFKGELWAGLGLSDYFDIGVIMPFILTQSVGAIEDGALGDAVSGASLGDLR